MVERGCCHSGRKRSSAAFRHCRHHEHENVLSPQNACNEWTGSKGKHYRNALCTSFNCPVIQPRKHSPHRAVSAIGVESSRKRFNTYFPNIFLRLLRSTLGIKARVYCGRSLPRLISDFVCMYILKHSVGLGLADVGETTSGKKERP